MWTAGLNLLLQISLAALAALRTEEVRNITAPPTVFWKGSITFHYGKLLCAVFLFEFFLFKIYANTTEK